jgi:hypothetical protein
MGYGLPREDCTLRDASPEEIAALADASGLCTIHFAPSRLDRQDLDDTDDLHPHIEITPGPNSLYLFGANVNTKFVHYVTTGSAAAGKQNKKEKKELDAHRDVDSKSRTGKKSLPDLTFTVTRYVACVSADSILLRIARLVFVHWVYSSSSAVARSSSGAVATRNSKADFFFWKAVSLITLCREGPHWPEGRHRARDSKAEADSHSSVSDSSHSDSSHSDSSHSDSDSDPDSVTSME